MAPSFNDLAEDNGAYDSEEELDFSGKYRLRSRVVLGWLEPR